MAAAMISDRGIGRKVASNNENVDKIVTSKRAPKRRLSYKATSVTSGPSDEHNNNNNNNTKKKRYSDSNSEMHALYQPWVIHTYGDLAKTKTITLKKYARILRALNGEEVNNADSSKFRFWVKAKGFYVGRPPGYEPKPADAIVGRFGLSDDGTNDDPVGGKGDPALYVPGLPIKKSPSGSSALYRKVAIVENFFDIIYSVHVELEGRGGKHAGQKRTYRTITETYAFLPREAVTRFLMGCTDCQRRPRSLSPPTSLPTPSPTPSPPLSLPLKTQDCDRSQNIPESVESTHLDNITTQQKYVTAQNGVNTTLSKTDSEPSAFRKIRPPRRRTELDNFKTLHTEQNITDHTTNPKSLDLSLVKQECRSPEHHTNLTEDARGAIEVDVPRPYNPLDVCNLTSKDRVKTPSKSYDTESQNAVVTNDYSPKSTPPPKKRSLCIPTENDEHDDDPPRVPWTPVAQNGAAVDYTTSYLKPRGSAMPDEDAVRLEDCDKISTPEPNEGNEEDQYQGLVKDADKLKLMLLAWNYHSQAQARAGVDGEAPVPPLANDDVAGLWASYHSALGLAKGRSPPREQSSPVLLPGDTGSTHDETSSSGQKDDEEGSEDESDERMDTLAHDPERLKAFNMFVRLFVDENLDRMVPISKQPKEKIQAIIDSCTRQFPEFAERARKRIRTYLKSCRRNKKCRDGTGTWDSNQTRPTPAHLTSVQAEQILAQACENESHNAKRMRVGLEPVSQPMPATTSTTTETTIAPSLSHYPALKSEDMAVTSLGVGFTTVTATPTASSTPKPVSMITDIKPVIGVSSSLLNGVSSIACTSTTPTSMYRPNFTQAFQRASTGLGGGAPGVGISTAGYTGTLFPAQTFNPALVGNGPTDLSMKSRPLLSHKLSGPEMGAVRQLITGYRESAAFLLRSADELETLLLQQQ